MRDKTIIILQARMKSTRLPGKVLADLNGISMLEYQINRLKKCKNNERIVIATTKDNSDDEIAKLGKKIGIKVYRGEEDDVLKRYADVANDINEDVIIRITGDCPLIDPLVVDQVVDLFYHSVADYVSNTSPPTYPDGLDVEVFSKDSLFKAQESCQDSYQREHVTPWIRDSGNFLVETLKNKEDNSYIRLTVDEPEDLNVVRSIINEFNDNSFALKDLVDLYKMKN